MAKMIFQEKKGKPNLPEF